MNHATWDGKMAIAQQVLTIVPAIYDAAVDPALWTIVLERLSHLIGGHCATIMQVGGDRGMPFITHGYSLDVLQDYYGPVAASNMFAHHARTAPAGTVLNDNDILPKHKFRDSQFYNEFLLKHLDADAVLTGMLWRDKSDLVALNICRDRNSSDFGTSEKELLRALIPHFAHAISTSRRLGDLEDRLTMAEDLIDKVSYGAIVAGPDGRVIHANRIGEALLRHGDAIAVCQDGLRAATPAGTAALRKLVFEASRGNGGVTALERPNHAGTVYVSATPLRPAPDTPAARVLLLLRDPANLPSFPADHLRSLFGLTLAEARVASLLQQGRTTAEIASILGISINTARVHLNALLSKTGTHRQPALMRLLMGLPTVSHPTTQDDRIIHEP